MSTVLPTPAESVQTSASQDQDDIWHYVCHCTDRNTSACGLDCTDAPWAGGDDDECPLCVLAWPDDAPTCPWGCMCEECGGPEDGAS